jgi:ABC-type antimicrobial peptide transport system permease subunit
MVEIGTPIRTRRMAPAGRALALATALAVAATGVLPAAPARAQDRSRGLPVIRDTEIEQLMRDYAQPILRSAGLAKQNVKVVVINDRAFNAFVMDGRHIFINAGALFEAKTPNEVIGVLAEQDSGFGGDANDQVILPLTTGYRYLFSGRAVVGTDYLVSSITLSAERSDQVSLIISEVEDLLRARHDLDIDEDNDFNVANQQQLLETFSEVSGTLTAMLGAIASVSLLVGGIGIMNISLVSVTERTKEIGLRKALGARRFQILQQFLIETVVLSTMGGVFGVLAGVGVAVLVNNSGLLNAVIAPEAILLGLGFSVAVGIFFGVYPANRAASLHPIEALRYE